MSLASVLSVDCEGQGEEDRTPGEAATKAQGRGEGEGWLGPTSSHGSVREGLESGCVLEVETRGFPQGSQGVRDPEESRTTPRFGPSSQSSCCPGWEDCDGSRFGVGATSSSVLAQVKLELRKGDLEHAGCLNLVLRERVGQRWTQEPAVGGCC